MNAYGLIFGYSDPDGLRTFTANRTVPSLPIACNYRVIDFILSSMVNAGIRNVGVIAREKYHSLLDHIGNGKSWDLSRKSGGITIMPPYSFTAVDYKFRGKMDVLSYYLEYIRWIDADVFVIADGDMVGSLPLASYLDSHEASDADITVVAASKFLYSSGKSLCCKVNEDLRVTDFQYGQPAGYHEILPVYIIGKDLLIHLVKECMAFHKVSFTEDVLVGMRDALKIQAQIFDGYVSRINTTKGYFDTNMDFLKRDCTSSVFLREQPVYTKIRDDAPVYYAPDSCVKNSLVGDGCCIEGKVENSIIFRGVHIGRGASVENSIVMQDSVIDIGAALSYVVTDKHVRIHAGRTFSGDAAHLFTIPKGCEM